MAQIREIKKRIKAVSNITRITRTMQMIATSKFARAQLSATATKPYTEGVFELVQDLASTAGNITHPLIHGPDGGFKDDAKELTLVLTSDRGLCGPYNGSVLRVAMKHLRRAESQGKASGLTELIGKKGASFLKFNGINVTNAYVLGDKPDYQAVSRIAQSYMNLFTRGEITSVRVIYMRFISVGKQTPEVLQLLPLKPPAVEKPADATGISAQYEFSPSASELLGDLLPQTVKATLFQCINDAIVSEHVARMIAMKAATDNAGKMNTSLKRTFNRARQSQITTELTEIISGAAALE